MQVVPKTVVGITCRRLSHFSRLCGFSTLDPITRLLPHTAQSRGSISESARVGPNSVMLTVQALLPRRISALKVIGGATGLGGSTDHLAWSARFGWLDLVLLSLDPASRMRCFIRYIEVISLSPALHQYKEIADPQRTLSSPRDHDFRESCCSPAASGLCSL